MTKPVIAVFLPVFFSALVICAIVLCTCAYCHKPNFFGFRRGGGQGDDHTSYSDSSIEKGEGPPGPAPPPPARRKQSRRHPRILETETVSVGGPGAFPGGGGHGRRPHAENVEIVDADGPDAEVIDVVDAHPDDEHAGARGGGKFLGMF
ncbi:hypothetical protein FN846DRAFT_886306 [Sphaerosporella brunnea]|uniref:Uncharacterized protein n=1 Tax=Sphaerosporella brunnea TaxID=1250544 RepID=A0A5J5FA29_9PEZI|nr:hypothetical protein FN846DRAFT_886306 [Sphaerosporella brunnea]